MKPDADRKRDLAAIHLLASQLGMDTADKSPTSDYRAMLQARGGCTSAAELDAAGRRRVLAHLRATAGVGKRRAQPVHGSWQADHIHRLWAELGALGVLNDPTERGLDRFVTSLTKLSSARFLPPPQANRVIEALKAWIARSKASPRA